MFKRDRRIKRFEFYKIITKQAENPRILWSICRGWGAFAYLKRVTNGLYISPFIYKIQIKVFASTYTSLSQYISIITNLITGFFLDFPSLSKAYTCKKRE